MPTLLEDLNGTTPEPTQCAYVSKRGNRCKFVPIDGDEFCALHCASLVRAKEMSARRIVANQDRAIHALETLVETAEDERVKLSAAVAILDRSGLGPKSTIEVEKSDLEHLTQEELEQRAERLLQALREKKAAVVPSITH